MSDSRTSKELISELRALDLPGVAPIARAAAAEIERLQATNVPKNGDVYLALVRSGYSQHEAHEIASMVESMQCQRHDCEVMRDELQELRAVHEPSLGRWISVQDDRPEPEVFVICWNGKRLDIEWFGSKHPREFGYTHWLAFPMPPGAASDMYDGARAFLTKSARHPPLPSETCPACKLIYCVCSGEASSEPYTV
jgi:hypothetical protein